MTTGLGLLAILSAVLAACGIGAVLAGALAARSFYAQASPPPLHRPPVTVLKPLCGDEPRLEDALASLCAQAYPAFQVVFGTHDAADPALRIVGRLRTRFPAADLHVVVDPALHGTNRKISNLINMLPHARHDVLVSSDSDLHVAPDYLERLVAALEVPGTGLVTTVVAGMPTAPGLAARLGATGISHSFTPGALLSRALGREDCLGTTMVLRRGTLERMGGLQALVDHLADDNVASQLVRGLGLRTGLARTVPRTGVPETSMRVLWQHELRWARTIAALAPLLYATSALQYPLFWALLAGAFSGGAAWAIGLFAAAWVARAVAAAVVDRALQGGRAPGMGAPIGLLPLRDVLSVVELVAAYGGDRVVWRGHAMRADDGRVATSLAALEPAALEPAALEPAALEPAIAGPGMPRGG